MQISCSAPGMISAMMPGARHVRYWDMRMPARMCLQWCKPVWSRWWKCIQLLCYLRISERAAS